MGENTSGTTFYVDFDRIRQHGGYVYFWVLGDNLKPTKTGVLSVEAYYQGDCKILRGKNLSINFYNQPMGRGTPDSNSSTNPEWKYPRPGSIFEEEIKSVCKFVK